MSLIIQNGYQSNLVQLAMGLFSEENIVFIISHEDLSI